MFSAGFGLISAARAESWLGPMAQGAGAILMFHKVRPWRPRAFAPNRLLEITPAFLDHALRLVRAIGFDLIALEDVPERLRRRSARKPFVVLTFDDGYCDNVDHALPILKRHGAPWTVFVTADFADGRGRLWWLELEEAVARLDRIVLSIGGEAFDLTCRSPREKQAAFTILYWRLRAGPQGRLRAAVAALAEEAGVDPAGLVRSLCLGWNELRALAREPGVSIGAHTLSHRCWRSMTARRPGARSRRAGTPSPRTLGSSRATSPIRSAIRLRRGRASFNWLRRPTSTRRRLTAPATPFPPPAGLI